MAGAYDSDPAQAPLPRPSCFCMRIIFLTGIWPPDVGGPATHGPEFARFLVEHGHEVTVVTMGDGEPDVRPCEVIVVSRAQRFPVRYGRVAAVAAQHAHRADIVYASATYAAASFASSVTRTPLVAKLVSDPAYERARRYGLFDGTLEEFQRPASRRVEALKRARTKALSRARALVVPSAYLARDRRRLGARPLAADGAPEPGAGGRRRRAGPSAPGHVHLRRPADPAEGARGRIRSRREGARRVSRRDRRRSGSRPARGGRPHLGGGRPDRATRRVAALRGPCCRGGIGGGAADERLGELPALGGRGSRGRGAGSLDRRGRGAGDRS